MLGIHNCFTVVIKNKYLHSSIAAVGAIFDKLMLSSLEDIKREIQAAFSNFILSIWYQLTLKSF